MSLLDKFAAVEVKNDERISDGDRRFCEIHQEAYSASLQVFKDLRGLWGGVVEAQQKIFLACHRRSGTATPISEQSKTSPYLK